MLTLEKRLNELYILDSEDAFIAERKNVKQETEVLYSTSSLKICSNDKNEELLFQRKRILKTDFRIGAGKAGNHVCHQIMTLLLEM